MSARSCQLLVPIFVALCCLLVSDSWAQKVGDRVVVTANADTKIVNEKVGKVFGGSIHTVVAIRDKWLSLDDVPGWLPAQYVMDLTMAEKYYDKRIKDNEGDAHAFAHRGMIHLENDDLQQAFADLDQSLRLDPQNYLTINNRGKVLYAQGRYDYAAGDFERAIRMNDKFPLAHYNLGLALYAMKLYDKSVESFDKAIALAPKNAWFFLSRGSAKLGQGDKQGAIADYQQSLKINRNLADAHVGISNVYLSNDDYPNALKFANEAVRMQPKNAMALNARGWIRYRMNDLEAAELDFNRAIRYAPKLATTYNNRGVVHAAKGDFDSAITDYNQALLLLKDSPVALANRGTAWMGKGEYEKAKQDFEKAIARSKDLVDAINGLAWFQATCPDDKFRDGQQAIKNAMASCKLSGHKDWNHLDTLAAAYAEAEDFENAIKWGEKALELAPEKKKPECQQRIALYKSNKPFRSSTGKTTAPNDG